MGQAKDDDEIALEMADEDGRDDLNIYAGEERPSVFRNKQHSHRTRSCDTARVLLQFRRRFLYIAVVVGLSLAGVIMYANLGPRRDMMVQALTRLAWTMQTPESSVKEDLDPDNLFYTRKQCRQHFPDLYKEVERSALYHQRHTGISKRDVDRTSSIYEGREGMIQFQIIKNQLYLTKFNGEHRLWTRVTAAIHALDRAVTTAVEPIPDIEAAFTDRDEGVSAVPAWVLDRAPEDEVPWLMPDYGFWSWPEPKVGSYREVRAQGLAVEERMSWNMKIPKLFWRGADMIPLRKQLIEMAKPYSWSDIRKIDWHNLGKGDRYSMGEHCQFKYLAHVEGETYSGRLKYLLNCKSVVVMHSLKWIQHFHHLMIPSGPSQNVVVVPGKDFDELVPTMDKLIGNDAEAQRIAENAWNDLRQKYLSPAATNCYWRELFHGYASVLTFKPKLTERSVPYESAIIMGTDSWEAY